MSVEVWQPTMPKQLTEDKLDQVVAMAEGIDVSATLVLDNPQADAWLMKLDANQWDIAKRLEDEEIVDLVKFFTLAEMQVPGWAAGKTSPVIPLVKLLKQRDQFSTALKQWIKANTDNRFLPNGAVLL